MASRRFLVIRLSAIGDVAMTIPVVYSVAKSNPTDEFTVLTQAFLIPLFRNKPKNVSLIGISIKGTEKTFAGLMRFVYALAHTPYDIVFDLHNVLRSMLIRSAFRMKGKPVYVIDKGRKEKARIIRSDSYPSETLCPMTERYADVFRKAGLAYEDHFLSLFDAGSPLDTSSLTALFGEKDCAWVGIAPFAKHEGKIYPLDAMEQVVASLASNSAVKLFFFGGRGEEETFLSAWASRYPQATSVAGTLRLDTELELISCLDVMLCMDSANMHFASLVGTKVVSIWGATHPAIGFYGYRQSLERAVQRTDLNCRPCSVFGDRDCHRGDMACMQGIDPNTVVEKVLEVVNER